MQVKYLKEQLQSMTEILPVPEHKNWETNQHGHAVLELTGGYTAEQMQEFSDTQNAALRELNDKLHAQLAEDTARWSGKAFAAEKQVRVLREALEAVLPWVVTQEVACHGLKCREAVCMSCDSDSEANVQLACDAYGVAHAAMENSLD